jgi:hypothetical protein
VISLSALNHRARVLEAVVLDDLSVGDPEHMRELGGVFSARLSDG